MKKKEVRDLIYSGLNIMSRNAFTLVKTDEAFVRTIPEGKQKIYVPLYDYNPVFKFSLTIGIRLDAVEEIFNLFSGADQKGQKLTVTSLTPLSYFTEGRINDYTVTNEIEIMNCIHELEALISSKIIDFLETYQTIASLHRAINIEQIPNFDISILISHAMHSVILAYLVRDESYKQLVNKYQDIMRNYNEFDKERFSKLVKYLNEHKFHK